MVSNFDKTILENQITSDSDYSEDSDEGWQSGTRNIPHRLGRLLYYKDFSDLTLQLTDGGQVKVHKLILAIHSPVFETQFYGSIPLLENTIEISGISTRAFKWIISYMYLGVITLEDIDMAVEIYTFAHEKQMERLVARCSKFLSGRVTVDNAMLLIEMATIYSDEELKSEAIFKLFEKRNCGLLSENIGDLSKNALLSLVSTEKIFCPEKDIFSAIYIWAKIQVQKRGNELSKSSIRKEMADFFPFINFLSMNSDFFISEVMKTGVLLSEESIAILNVINKRNATLPSFVSLSMADRFFKRERMNHKFTLNTYPPCNKSFIYNHTHETYCDKIILFKATENLFIKSINLRPGCYTGNWKMHILNSVDESEVGASSNDYSPWSFNEMVQIEANKNYLFVARGKGKRAKHVMNEYDNIFNNIGFSGFAIACCITIHFCV